MLLYLLLTKVAFKKGGAPLKTSRAKFNRPPLPYHSSCSPSYFGFYFSVRTPTTTRDMRVREQGRTSSIFLLQPQDKMEVEVGEMGGRGGWRCGVLCDGPGWNLIHTHTHTFYSSPLLILSSRYNTVYVRTICAVLRSGVAAVKMSHSHNYILHVEPW